MGTEAVARAVLEFQRGVRRDENFRLLFRRYHAPLRRFLAQRVFSPEERLDLTQECFLRIYQGLEKFRGEGKFDTWVFRIAHNCYLKWLRRQKGSHGSDRHRSPEEARGGQLRESTHPPPGAVPPRHTPLDEVLEQERKQLLREAIEDLPKQMRKCLILRVYQELSVKEIAATLRLSAETVKVHLFQGRKKLRPKLEASFRDLDFELGEERARE